MVVAADRNERPFFPLSLDISITWCILIRFAFFVCLFKGKGGGRVIRIQKHRACGAVVHFV